MSSELSIGTVFAERYRVERRLAAGGMGAVYEVVHIETNRRRALKVLHAKFLQSDALRKRFRQEARVSAEIDSEHIVDIFDAGIDRTTQMPFLVMELLRGEDLRARVRRDGPLPSDEVIRCLYETCLALEKTHRANIVHRDLKPDNLFLCTREHGPPRIKILDFGIAKIVADEALDTRVTQSLGTPMYMAPEQFSMNSSVSPATDVFALGLIAYTLLVGKPYWLPESKKAHSPIAFALHAAKGPRQSPVARAAALNIQLPPAFDPWFFRTTAEIPEHRFPSAMTAIAELADILGTTLPQETTHGKSGPISVDDTMLLFSSSDEPIAHDTPAQPGNPHSVSLLAVRTVGGSEIAACPPPSRPRRIMVITGVVGILIAGPTFDMVFGSRPRRETAAASATVTSALEKAPETLVSTTPSASPPVAMPNGATRVSAVAGASASTAATTSSKSPPVRPSGTISKAHDGVIWNND